MRKPAISPLQRRLRRLPDAEAGVLILTLLMERPSEVISREELRQRLWPSDVFVDFESSVNNAVKKLRAALGDSNRWKDAASALCS